MVYKWCVVPQCINTSINSPQKLFVSVPTNPKRRKNWLQLARRNSDSIVTHSNVFMCEDHFDMKKDIINYMQYKMGFSQKILLSDNAVPSKFNCQEDHKIPLSDAGSSQEVGKRKRIDLGTECLQSEMVTETHAECLQKDVKPEIIKELTKTQFKNPISDIITEEKFVQGPSLLVMEKKTGVQNKSISTSPLKVSTASHFTSPSKIEPCHLQLSLSEIVKEEKENEVIQDKKPDNGISRFETEHSSSFVPVSSSKVTDSNSNVSDTIEDIEKLQCFSNTMQLIAMKPLMYIGISNKNYFLIQLLQKHTTIKIKHIFLCLKKIRFNTTFSELGYEFGISSALASKLFLRNIPIITRFLKAFLVNSDKRLIRKNLPIAFRHDYHNVSCIIGCLEIDIEKPSQLLHNVMTWSESKNRNTVKYLISWTPNGLVNYVSQGFGGRTSDITLVENCKFLDGLQKGTCILADGCFKHLEQVLQERDIKLLRLPSVVAGANLSKPEVRQNKIIASMRYHIESVTRRLREFYMLEQHSVINSSLVCVLDNVIVIACALINLQNPLDKR